MPDRDKNRAKSPDELREGGDTRPMTPHQKSHLDVLTAEAGERNKPMTRTEAERRIDALQKKTGKKP